MGQDNVYVTDLNGMNGHYTHVTQTTLGPVETSTNKPVIVVKP